MVELPVEAAALAERRLAGRRPLAARPVLVVQRERAGRSLRNCLATFTQMTAAHV
jgi:hypothetical protein